MFDEYVCKIRVSTTSTLINPQEATAFGFNDNETYKLLTAGHVVTNTLGAYPMTNTVQLYVQFENYLGVLNQTPVVVTFELNNCNDSLNYIFPSPFVDLAEISVEALNPVTKYFRRTNLTQGDRIIGIGYPAGSSLLTSMPGVATLHQPVQCTKHINNCSGSTRHVVNHNSHPGCSGGPYIKLIEDEPYVIGSMIGLVQPNVNALQSADDF